MIKFAIALLVGYAGFRLFGLHLIQARNADHAYEKPFGEVVYFPPLLQERRILKTLH